MTISIEATQAGLSATDWSFRAEGVTKIYGQCHGQEAGR